MLRVVSAAAALLTAHLAAPAAGAKLEESAPLATSLGYREDTRKVDDRKFPKHSASQTCISCQLYQGTPKDVAGKQVAGAGWCSAWVKKAG